MIKVLALTLCQALAQSANPLVIITAALVGAQLAPSAAMATLPVGLAWVGTMLTAVPAAKTMQHIGRRWGFTSGTGLGLAGGLLGAHAILSGSFPLFCLACLCHGGYVAFTNYYRFAAVEMVAPERRGRAIGLVLTGGVVAAVAGPTLANLTYELTAPVLFAGCYLAIAVLAVLNALALQIVPFAPPSREDRASGGRPLAAILRQPRAIAAVSAAAIGYGVMALVMTVTPMAMELCGHEFTDATFVIEWHALAMFAPSFVTGRLIERFGAPVVIAAGLAATMGCVAVNLSGITLWHFWSALVLLGLGWNFLFVGGTALLTTTYRHEERSKVQGANEFVVFGTVTVCAFASGPLLDGLGWAVVNLAMLPALAIAFFCLLRIVVVRPAVPAE